MDTDVRRRQFKDAVILEGPIELVGAAVETLVRAAEADQTYTESELATIQLLRARCTKTEKTGKAGTRASTRRKPPKGTKAKDKAKAFKTDQYLFENDRQSLASRLLDGKEADAKCDLEPDIVEATYKERFGGPSQEVDLSAYPPAEPVNNDTLLCPFTSKQVKAALAKAKKGTAAGPDKIDLAKLKSADRQGKALMNLFNTWLLMGHVQAEVKKNRSILLPKGSEGLDNIYNWRPLTISSILLRVLRAFRINERQRGFMKASGCAENGFPQSKSPGY